MGSRVSINVMSSLYNFSCFTCIASTSLYLVYRIIRMEYGSDQDSLGEAGTLSYVKIVYVTYIHTRIALIVPKYA